MNHEIIWNPDELEELLFGCGIIIDPDARDADIPMDSVMFISMIVELENRYELQIPDGQLLYKHWKTCRMIADNVEQLLEEQKAKQAFSSFC